MKRFAILTVLILAAFANAGIVYDEVWTEYFGSQSYSHSENVLIDGGFGGGLLMSGHCYANINNTGTSSITDLAVSSYAAIDVYGGTINYFEINSVAHANLYGGNISALISTQLFTQYSPYINMYVKDYNFVSTSSILSGHWGDGSAFNINIENSTNPDHLPTYDSIAFTIVPEPTTLALLGIGGLVLRRRRL